MTSQRTPSRRSTFDHREMLGIIARLSNGETIGQAVRPIRGADRQTFFRTLHKEPRWRQIIEKLKPDIAWGAVDDWREAAMECVAANPASPAAVTALGKSTLAVAKALDPHTWGERPDAAPRQAVVIQTNLDFGVVDRFEKTGSCAKAIGTNEAPPLAELMLALPKPPASSAAPGDDAASFEAMQRAAHRSLPPPFDLSRPPPPAHQSDDDEG